MGICSFQTNEVYPFNARVLIVFLSILSLGIANSVFFLFEAKTMPEYGNSFYRGLSEFTVMIDDGLTLCLISSILKLIGSCEHFIEKSQFQIRFQTQKQQIVLAIYFNFISIRIAS